METKFCSNCGNKILEDSNFCPNCGALISKTPTPPMQRGQMNSKEEIEEEERIRFEVRQKLGEKEKQQTWRIILGLIGFLSFFIGLVFWPLLLLGVPILAFFSLEAIVNLAIFSLEAIVKIFSNIKRLTKNIVGVSKNHGDKSDFYAIGGFIIFVGLLILIGNIVYGLIVLVPGILIVCLGFVGRRTSDNKPVH